MSATPPLWYSNPSARSWRTMAPDSAAAFHRTLDGYEPTPLVDLPAAAEELGVGRVLLKDESHRLGLPAFKILGASWAVCRALCARYGSDAAGMTVPRLRELVRSAGGATDAPVLVTATDGNHGRAVARMVSLLGLTARVYVPAGLSPQALDGIRAEGTRPIEIDAGYDDVVALAAASTEGRTEDVLIQDTAWEGYTEVPRWIVDGYTTLFREVDQALRADGPPGPGPDLVSCPVGVGSLAQAMVEHYRGGDSGGSGATGAPALLCCEPDSAACVLRSLWEGAPVTVGTSSATAMAGLNCGTPSTLGWPVLQAGLDAATGVSEEACRRAVEDLRRWGQDAGPCGAAALAGVRAALADPERRRDLGIGEASVVVMVNTEGRAANPLP